MLLLRSNDLRFESILCKLSAILFGYPGMEGGKERSLDEATVHLENGQREPNSTKKQ